MKKQNLMQEFESLKVENANAVYGGMDDYWEKVYCEEDTQYTTFGTPSKTDIKKDQVVDGYRLVMEADATFVAKPWVPDPKLP